MLGWDPQVPKMITETVAKNGRVALVSSMSSKWDYLLWIAYLYHIDGISITVPEKNKILERILSISTRYQENSEIGKVSVFDVDDKDLIEKCKNDNCEIVPFGLDYLQNKIVAWDPLPADSTRDDVKSSLRMISLYHENINVGIPKGMRPQVGLLPLRRVTDLLMIFSILIPFSSICIYIWLGILIYLKWRLSQ